MNSRRAPLKIVRSRSPENKLPWRVLRVWQSGRANILSVFTTQQEAQEWARRKVEAWERGEWVLNQLT